MNAIGIKGTQTVWVRDAGTFQCRYNEKVMYISRPFLAYYFWKRVQCFWRLLPEMFPRVWIFYPVHNENFQMVDPTNNVVATHYTTIGDYTLQAGGGGTHNVICEKVLDQYKEEREICDTATRTLDITGNLKIRNDAGIERNLEYVGKTTYKRAHAICQAKGI